MSDANVGGKPSLTADREVLEEIVRLGGSLFEVNVSMDETGKVIKKPGITKWQDKKVYPIDGYAKLDASNAPMYGFQPEDIGAYVIDLDCKKGKDGEASLAASLGPSDGRTWLTSPEVYVDTPNGRHLYFRRPGLHPEILRSANNVLPGVDIRGERSTGWLVAPGSVGWSDKRETWTRYELVGSLDKLPEIPEELLSYLKNHFIAQDHHEERREGPPQVIETAADIYMQHAGEGFDMIPTDCLEDDSMAAMFKLARGVVRTPKQFEKWVFEFIPEAHWEDRRHREILSSNYMGGPGNSCHWTPSKGIIKDFNDSLPAFDIIDWIAMYEAKKTRKGAIDRIAAARIVLKWAGIADPSRPEPEQDVKLAEYSQKIQDMAHDGFVPESFPLTDTGNAERFAYMAKGKDHRNFPNCLYANDAKEWLKWTGFNWKEDPDGTETMADTKTVARSIVDNEITQPAYDKKGNPTFDPTDPKIKRILKWSEYSESAKGRNAMLTLAKSEPDLSTEITKFDANHDELNTPAGIVALPDGHMMPHRPDKMHRLMTGVAPEEGDPIRFLTFLDQILMGDTQLIDWMQMFFGYSLTGHTSDQIFPIFWGGGSNGKSTLLHVIERVMGTYFQTAKPDTFVEQNGGGHARDDLAKLAGARLILTSEPTTGSGLQTSLIKEITGGEQVTCRFLYGRFFSYRPTYKAILITNHKPRVKESDKGTWRRVRFVPFQYTVDDSERDPNLEQKIIEEEAGRVLNWMIKGAVKWYKIGVLPNPDTIHNATQEYRDEEDTIGQYIEARCLKSMTETWKVAMGTVYKDYKIWIEDQGGQAISTANFSRRMAEHDVAKKKCRIGQSVTWAYIGLQLQANE